MQMDAQCKVVWSQAWREVVANRKEAASRLEAVAVSVRFGSPPSKAEGNLQDAAKAHAFFALHQHAQVEHLHINQHCIIQQPSKSTVNRRPYILATSCLTRQAI